MNEDMFVKPWLRHRQVLIELLDLIPDHHMDFRPFEGAMSLGDLAVHIATSCNWFLTAVRNGRFERPSTKPEAADMAAVRDLVRTLTEKNREEMAALTPEQINGIVQAKDFLGFDAPGKTFLHASREHEIHHKGQMYVYAHLAGVEKVPFFINNNV